jgi:hypothetical protein
MSGAFATAALQLRGCGLAPIPLGGDDGKAPKVHGFNAWTSAPSLQTYAKWTRRFSNDNVGTPTGCASKVFVVDADERGLEGKIEERFGATPLWVTSPRGGAHAYYRYGGEACGDLRAEGLPIDLKGRGGIVVLPPSIRPSGEFAGRHYELAPGCSWEMLRELPCIKPGALSVPDVCTNIDTETEVGLHPEGTRNNTLFRHALAAARHVDDLDALLDVARTFVAQQCDHGGHAVSDREILKTAESAWQYETGGRNWIGSERMIMGMRASTAQAVLAHPQCSDAWLMFLVLKDLNWRRAEFTASPSWFEVEQTIPGWRRARYRHALAALVELQMIRVTHRGGAKSGDPRLYRFV